MCNFLMYDKMHMTGWIWIYLSLYTLWYHTNLMFECEWVFEPYSNLKLTLLYITVGGSTKVGASKQLITTKFLSELQSVTLKFFWHLYRKGILNRIMKNSYSNLFPWFIIALSAIKIIGGTTQNNSTKHRKCILD